MVYRYTLILWKEVNKDLQSSTSANQQRPSSGLVPKSTQILIQESSVNKEEYSDAYARTYVFCIWLLYIIVHVYTWKCMYST